MESNFQRDINIEVKFKDMLNRSPNKGKIFDCR